MEIFTEKYLCDVAMSLLAARLQLDQAYDSGDKRAVDMATHNVGEEERYLLRCAIRYAAIKANTGLPKYDRYDPMPVIPPDSVTG